MKTNDDISDSNKVPTKDIVPGISNNSGIATETYNLSFERNLLDASNTSIISNRHSGLIDSLNIQKHPLLLSRLSTSRLSISSSESSGSAPQSPGLAVALSPDFGVFSPQLENASLQGPDALDGYLRAKLVSVLKTHPLLNKAKGNDDFITSISHVMSMRSYKPGANIIKEGDLARAMFFIIKGAVQVISDDGELIVCELVEGGFFGEIGILFEVNRTATVVTKQKCILAVLKKEDFDATLTKFPDIAQIIRQEARERYLALKAKMEKLGKNLKTTLPHNLQKSGNPAAKGAAALESSLNLGKLEHRDVTLADVEELLDTDSIGGTELKRLSPAIRSSMTLSGPTSTPFKTATESTSIEQEDVLTLCVDNLNPPTGGQASPVSAGASNIHFRSREQDLDRSMSSKSSHRSNNALNESGDSKRSPTTARSMAEHFGLQYANSGQWDSKDDDEPMTCDSDEESGLPSLLKPSILDSDEVMPLMESASRRNTVSNTATGRNSLKAPTAEEDIPLFGKELMEYANLPGSRDSYASEMSNLLGGVDILGHTRSRASSAASNEALPNSSVSLATSFISANASNHGPAISGGRRASVAIWADEKLMQYAQNQANRSRTTSLSSSNGASIPGLNASGTAVPGTSIHRQASVSSRLATSFNASQLNTSHLSTLSSDTQALDSDESLETSAVTSPFVSREFSKTKPETKNQLASFQSLPLNILVQIGRYFDLAERLKLSLVSKSLRRAWFEPHYVVNAEKHTKDAVPGKNALTRVIDVSLYNKKINEVGLTGLARIAGEGALELNLRGCWPISDQCMLSINGMLPNILVLNLSGCWDLTDTGIFAIASGCPQLKFLDLSNCRKLTDASVVALLAYCRGLEDLCLSYCKCLSDNIFTGNNILSLCPPDVAEVIEGALRDRINSRSVSGGQNSETELLKAGLMHLWTAVKRVNFQRCSGLSDEGFQFWMRDNLFELNFEEVLLPDCSFLTDKSLEAVLHSCKRLKVLNVSFCCALSEKVADYILKSHSKQHLEILDLSFCGNMVTDDVLTNLLQLPSMKRLSIRGCVQATDAFLKIMVTNAGKTALNVINISQCAGLDQFAEAKCAELGFTVLRTESLLSPNPVSIFESRALKQATKAELIFFDPYKI